MTSILNFTIFFAFSPNNPNDTGSTFINLLMPLLLIVVFYFFLIRPQQKKQKEREKTLDSLKKGDKVVTIGGLHGKVVGINPEKKTVMIDAGDVKLTFDRSAIATIEGVADGKSETAEKLESAS
ncbi:MAG: preprotein translocase subunit YajC [Chloroherpetonaceae bacterium]|nr:preprotein translocase subunit YajC [Chloroherpetonaceae bacterium]